MDFVEYASPKRSWHLDTTQLRHRYFVQTAPDRQHLVTGMLQQGNRPRSGRWLELGTIREKLAHRYFVQQTSFNTLVPGSLIQTDEPPGENWKDIQTYDLFYYFDFGTPYMVWNESEETIFTTSEDFITEVVTPALNQVYPGRDPGTSITLKIYYTTADYNTVQNDPSLLIPFSSGDQLINYFLTDSETYTDTFESNTAEPANLVITPEAAFDFYSIVLEVMGQDNAIKDYIYLNYILRKFLPG